MVVSAGNEGGPVDAPANCAGVAGIAGLRQVGTKVGFSSLGPEIALSAPGGNCVNSGAGEPCLFSIETTINSGTTTPATNTYTDEFHFNVGTSFSAPIVAGIAGLMLAVNGNLNSNQLIARLQLGATAPFPTPAGLPVCHLPSGPQDLQTSECACTTAVCGAGMANANGAVQQALRPIAAFAPPTRVTAGVAFVLDGSGSAAACGAKIASYQWTFVEPVNGPSHSEWQQRARHRGCAHRIDRLPAVADRHGYRGSHRQCAGHRHRLLGQLGGAGERGAERLPHPGELQRDGATDRDCLQQRQHLRRRRWSARSAHAGRPWVPGRTCSAASHQTLGRLQPLALRASVVPGRDARLLQQLARNLLRLLFLTLRLQ